MEKEFHNRQFSRKQHLSCYCFVYLSENIRKNIPWNRNKCVISDWASSWAAPGRAVGCPGFSSSWPRPGWSSSSGCRPLCWKCYRWKKAILVGVKLSVSDGFKKRLTFSIPQSMLGDVCPEPDPWRVSRLRRWWFFDAALVLKARETGEVLLNEFIWCSKVSCSDFWQLIVAFINVT